MRWTNKDGNNDTLNHYDIDRVCNEKIEINKTNGATNQYIEYSNLILKSTKQAVLPLLFSRKKLK